MARPSSPGAGGSPDPCPRRDPPAAWTRTGRAPCSRLPARGGPLHPPASPSRPGGGPGRRGGPPRRRPARPHRGRPRRRRSRNARRHRGCRGAASRRRRTGSGRGCRAPSPAPRPRAGTPASPPRGGRSPPSPRCSTWSSRSSSSTRWFPMRGDGSASPPDAGHPFFGRGVSRRRHPGDAPERYGWGGYVGENRRPRTVDPLA